MKNVNFISFVGHKFLNWVCSMGKAFMLLFDVLLSRPEFKKNYSIVLKEIYKSGILSLPIIVVSSIFIGMVISFQGYVILVNFGAESSLGQLISLSLLRELGPVITALLFIGRACTSITAEIGLMKATEQLSSLEVMGINPLKRVISPRFWSCLIAVPILTLIFVVIGVWGGYIVAVYWNGVNGGEFLSSVQDSINLKYDVLNCIIKSFMFALVGTLSSLYHGYYAKPTPDGLGSATTKAVVQGSLLVLGMDFILTFIMFGN